MKAVPRLIGELRRLKDKYGLTNLDGLSRMLVIDRTLRKYDGFQERLLHDYHPIDVDRPEPRTLRAIQSWNWWWATGEWQKNPRKPWDPRVDEKDQAEDAPPPPTAKK